MPSLGSPLFSSFSWPMKIATTKGQPRGGTSKACWLKQPLLTLQCNEPRPVPLKADFHPVEFSEMTGDPLFSCENVALNLNRMSRMTKVLLFQIQSARKILLSGNHS